MSELMNAALKYSELGFLVLPLKPGDKTPVTDHAVKNATGNCRQIRDWWTENPNYNIGLAMGNGFIALDFDEDETKDKHGLETLRSWEMKHGKQLPDTWIHLTPRGGVHYIYRDPYGYKSNPKLYEDVELRASGYYIVAPPSRRADGKVYVWECGYSPEDMDAAIIDDIVKEFLIGEIPETKKKGFMVPEKIPDGERHNVLTSLIGWERAIGVPEEAIRLLVEKVNDLLCEPPLSNSELEKTIFPALSKDWPATHPFWKFDEGDRDRCWMQEEIYLLRQKIKQLTNDLRNTREKELLEISPH